jgi:hypothetical protein
MRARRRRPRHQLRFAGVLMGERRFTRHAVSVGLRRGCQSLVPSESGKPVGLPILVG